jgi:hypothetical protein
MKICFDRKRGSRVPQPIGVPGTNFGGLPV